jgi:hypothetical protein
MKRFPAESWPIVMMITWTIGFVEICSSLVN